MKMNDSQRTKSVQTKVSEARTKKSMKVRKEVNICKGEIKNLNQLEKLSQLLIPFLKPNTFLILQGELGAGKTTLTQLIAKNLGIKEKVNSPTFNILQRYKIKSDHYLNHFDFFRLTSADNLISFQELTINNLNIIE